MKTSEQWATELGFTKHRGVKWATARDLFAKCQADARREALNLALDEISATAEVWRKEGNEAGEMGTLRLFEKVRALLVDAGRAT